jgi:S1-C subfamily serine protease
MRPCRLMLTALLTFVAHTAVAQGLSSGTAFSVAPELLITNAHVVKGCASVDVISPDGRRTGWIGAADGDVDLAILRVNGLSGTTARLRSPRNVLLGEPVLVFGYPLASSGMLSSALTLLSESGLRINEKRCTATNFR